MNKRFFNAVVRTALLAGTLDIVAAMLNLFIPTGKNPVLVLQFIASGVFGKEAFANTTMMAVYGLLFHYGIAAIWTLIYFTAYNSINTFTKNWILSGISYAFAVWIIMTFVVLPLSNVPSLPFSLGKAALAIVILVVCIGLPISFYARKFYDKSIL